MTLLNTSLIRRISLFLVATMFSLSAMALDFNKVQREANQGVIEAQAALGTMYFLGEGVDQDYVVAKEWFGKSSDNGNQKGCDLYKTLNQR